MNDTTIVTTAGELAAAVQIPDADIEVRGELRGMAMITLAPGVRLRGGTLDFGAKGVRLTRDNVLERVTVRTADGEVAVLNDTTVDDLGTLTLRDVRTVGQVLLLAEDRVRRGCVRVEGLTISSADVHGSSPRPHGFDVEALQGAFTLWNRQPDPDVEVTAELLDISAGTEATPVRGSGMLVGGHARADGRADGGTVRVSRLRTGEIHADGAIPLGTGDLIASGVFVFSGAIIDRLINRGPVTTYGPNDMVLANWGCVRRWTVAAPVTSHGPGGSGVVNLGDIDSLDVQAPIQTFGTGAHGFDLHDGSLQEAWFDSIATHGDGSIGVEVSRPLPSLAILGDLTTDGGERRSLVSAGKVVLKATALTVKPGGRIGYLHVGGTVRTAGADVITVEIDGDIDTLTVDNGISAAGERSDAVHLRGGGPDLADLEITAAHGRDIVRTPRLTLDG